MNNVSESKNQKWLRSIIFFKIKCISRKGLVFCAMFDEDLLLYCNEIFIS